MGATNLQTPILAGGIFWNNFFNGRLLSGEDLSKEQADNLEGRQRLGRGIGDGVASGLQVAQMLGSPPGQTTVTITAGLAINRLGQALVLPADTNVSLVPPANSSAPAAAGFANCQPLQPGVYIAGAGVYLLTIAPATGTDGRVPTSGLGNIAATCNTRYTVEGVQFRLISISGALATELTDPGHLRNRLAYKCYGQGDTNVSGFVANPFGAVVSTYGLLDTLRSTCLTDCDVPLAVMYWTSTGIQFLDMWSVRRRVTRPAADGDWALLSNDRRVSEAEARFLQFETQIEELRTSGIGLSALPAAERFSYLPPVGIIPIANFGSAGGFDYQSYFGTLKTRGPIVIEGAGVERLVRDSLPYSPIDLSSGVMIWLYLVRENSQRIDQGRLTPPQSYLVFASGYIPPQGAARFNVSRWNYSNYTIV